MQAFIILALGLVLTTFGIGEWQRNSTTSTPEIQKLKAQSLASNVYLYNNLAMNYLLSNYESTTFYDANAVITNNIYYKPSNDFNLLKMKYIYNNDYIFNTNYDFGSTYFLYLSSPSDLDINPIPVMYLLTTWTSNSPKENVDMFGELNKIIDNKKNGGDSTFWVNSVYGSYNDTIISGSTIKQVVLYSELPKNYQLIDSQNKVLSILNKLSSYTSTNMLKLKTVYFYLTPVYSNN